MGFAQFETKKLALIPAYYTDLKSVPDYRNYSGGQILNSYLSIAGSLWKATSANDWIEFGFRGSICGILFSQPEGNCDILIDGETVVDNLDISTIKGAKYNLSYIIKTDLADEYHTVRVVANDDKVKVIGILVDSRLNYYEFNPFPLVKFNSEYVWDNQSVSAGGVSGSIDVSQARQFGFYVEVSAATTIELQVDARVGWATYDSINFSGAGSDFRDYHPFPYDTIRFRSTQAATISLYIWRKK